MKRPLFVAFAVFALALSAIGTGDRKPAIVAALAAAPTSAPFQVQVGAAAYPGAASEALLISDFQNAYFGTESCWPLNDQVGVTGVALLNQCSTGGNIGFSDASGFTAGDTSPALISANDQSSVQFSSQTAALQTTTLLSSLSPWTVGFVFNAAAAGSNEDLVNTGAAAQGTGMELSLDATGHVRFSLGNGASSYSLIVSNAADTSAASNHYVFASWQPGATAGSGTATLVLDNVAKTLSVSNFSAGSTPLEIVHPVSGAGTIPFVGNMAWLSYFPTVLSSTIENSLYVDMSGAVAPVAVATPDPNAPVTHIASDFVVNQGMVTEFNYSSTAADVYLKTQAIAAIKFMGAARLRDADNSLSTSPYNTFCSSGIGFSQGFNVGAGNQQWTAAGQGILSVTDVTSKLDAIKAATGCYPSFIEPANELDNSGNGAPAALFVNDPNCTPQGNSYVEMWASLYVQQMHTLRAAQQSGNGKYSGIKVFGAPLALPEYGELSQAQECYYGQTLFPVDAAVQHSGLKSQYAAPESANGLLPATLALVYAEDPNGFSGYANAGPNKVPPTWDEFGEGYITPYESAGTLIDDPLATHYVPRLMLRMYDLGLNFTNYWDFLSDHTCQYSTGTLNHTGGCSFSQNGFIDLQGNLKPQGYTFANLNHMLAAGNTPGALNSATQLNFSVLNSSNATPANLAKYAFENDDGSYWIVLNDGSEEGLHYPNGAQTAKNGCTGAPAPAGPCYNVYAQGSHWGAFVGFTTVKITGLPNTITHAAVYQNDEYCDATQTQVSTTWGTPLRSYPAGADSDCFQWWPAGSLVPSIQPSYPTVSNGTITGLKYNGMPLLIRVSASRIPAVPTATPLPEYAVATPTPPGTPPTAAASLYFPATPVPSFSPPSGIVPTPPA